jgi:fructose-1,6-bisphosphatase I
MSNKLKIITLAEFVIANKPDMLPIFVQLETCLKIISSKLRVASLENLTGLTGTTNVYGEEVQKLDEFANQLLVDKMLASGKVGVVLSEELENPVYKIAPIKGLAPQVTGVIQGVETNNYIFAMDPIDGSSNIDISLPVGTIFSLYNNNGTLLQQGKDQVCAGYVLYSSATVIVLTFGDGVYTFTLDSEVDCFFLTDEKLRIPDDTKIYSINEGNYNKFFDQTKKFLTTAKDQEYKLRYVCSMVGDVHRNLLKGGIFIYPGDVKSPNGKLRLLYEINPMAMLLTQAGGQAFLEDGTDPMTIVPTKHDQTLPIILGSKVQVQLYLDCKYTNHTINPRQQYLESIRI